MEQRAAPSAPRSEAVGKHTQHGSIDFALDIAVGPSVADESEELSLVPLLGVDLRRDLLGEHVERCVRHDQTVKLAAIGTINQRRTFHKIVVGEGKQTALWLPADTMARSAHALKESRNRARRAKLADEIHVANIDAKLEGGRCHHGGECTYLQPMLRVEPLLFGEAAMMRGDAHFAESVCKLARDAFGHAPRVDEDKRRAMGFDEFRQSVIDLIPDFSGHHRFEWGRWHFELKIPRPVMAAIDDQGQLPIFAHADEKPCNLLDRLLRRR